MDPIITVSASFNQPIKKVWCAITVHDEMIQWFFDQIPDFKAEVGFKTQFNVTAPSSDFMHLWEIKEVIPLEKIVYKWHYEGIPGEGEVIFELFNSHNSTKLVLTNKILKPFPSDIPEFTTESCLGGWNYFIKQQLKSYLEKT